MAIDMRSASIPRLPTPPVKTSPAPECDWDEPQALFNLLATNPKMQSLASQRQLQDSDDSTPSSPVDQSPREVNKPVLSLTSSMSKVPPPPPPPLLPLSSRLKNQSVALAAKSDQLETQSLQLSTLNLPPPPPPSLPLSSSLKGQSPLSALSSVALTAKSDQLETPSLRLSTLDLLSPRNGLQTITKLVPLSSSTLQSIPPSSLRDPPPPPPRSREASPRKVTELAPLSSLATEPDPVERLTLQLATFSLYDDVVVDANFVTRGKQYKTKLWSFWERINLIVAELLCASAAKPQNVAATFSSLHNRLETIANGLYNLDDLLNEYLHQLFHTENEKQTANFRKYVKRKRILDVALQKVASIRLALTTQKARTDFSNDLDSFVTHLRLPQHTGEGKLAAREGIVSAVEVYFSKFTNNELQTPFTFCLGDSATFWSYRYPTAQPIVDKVKKAVLKLQAMQLEILSFGSKFSLTALEDPLSIRREALNAIKQQILACKQEMILNCKNQDLVHGLSYFAYLEIVISDLESVLFTPFTPPPPVVTELYKALEKQNAFALHTLINSYDKKLSYHGVTEKTVAECITALASRVLVDTSSINPISFYQCTAFTEGMINLLATEVARADSFKNDDEFLSFILYLMNDEYSGIASDLQKDLKDYKARHPVEKNNNTDAFFTIFTHIDTIQKNTNPLVRASYFYECQQLLSEIDPVSQLHKTLKTRAANLLRAYSIAYDVQHDLFSKALYSRSMDTRNDATRQILAKPELPKELFYEFVLVRFKNNETLTKEEESSLIDCLKEYLDDPLYKQLFRKRFGEQIELLLYTAATTCKTQVENIDLLVKRLKETRVT